MKILNLKIVSPDNEIIRDITFNYNGISFIYGNIQLPEDPTSTINSLGKTLLLKMIDFIYGANIMQNIPIGIFVTAFYFLFVLFHI